MCVSSHWRLTLRAEPYSDTVHMVYMQSGRTALHLAHSAEVATMLLNKGAKADHTDQVCAGCVKVIHAGSVGRVRGRCGLGCMRMCL